MSSESNKALVRCFMEEFISQGKVELADELLTPDYINYMPGSPEPRHGIIAEKELLVTWRNAFPDYRMVVEDLVAEGDRVLVRSTFSGTQRGEFQGIPATGKQVTMQVMSIIRVENGRIAENRPTMDALGMLTQLGVIPAPA